MKHLKNMENQKFFRKPSTSGGGPYKLAKGFGHLGVDGEKWGENVRETLLKSCCKAGMDASDDRSVHSKPSSSISIQPADSGISSIPFPVLQNMFTKAESLLSDKVPYLHQRVKNT